MAKNNILMMLELGLIKPETLRQEKSGIPLPYSCTRHATKTNGRTYIEQIEQIGNKFRLSNVRVSRIKSGKFTEQSDKRMTNPVKNESGKSLAAWLAACPKFKTI